MTVAATLSYGELSAMFPKADWTIHLHYRNFRKRLGFLYGWGMFTVIQTGTIAAVAVAFGKFSAYLFPALNDAAPLFKVANLKLLDSNTWYCGDLFAHPSILEV